MIMSMCDVPDVLKVMKIIKTVILIIKIVVPIILIITAMISFMKEITNNEDLGKSLQVFVKKAIAAVVIFLVPTFISLISNAVLSNNNYIKCFDNANNAKIQELYVAKVKVLLKDAKESYDRTTYNQAMKYYDELIEFRESVGIKNESLDDPEIGSDNAEQVEIQKEIEGYKKELDAMIEVIEEKEKEEIELKRQEEEKKRQQEQGSVTPSVIVTPNAAPTDVPGYSYITAKSPASTDTAAFLEVAKSTWLSIVNGDTRFHYQDWTRIPIPAGQGYVDCSGYVSQALYNFGYVVGNNGYQATTSTLYSTNYKNKYGWEEIPIGASQDITNIVQPGDIVVRIVYYKNAEGESRYRGHTNIVASVTNGNILTYDAGSDNSLTYGKYPNGYPTLNGNFYKAADGRAGKIIRVKAKPGTTTNNTSNNSTNNNTNSNTNNSNSSGGGGSGNPTRRIERE